MSLLRKIVSDILSLTSVCLRYLFVIRQLFLLLILNSLIYFRNHCYPHMITHAMAHTLIDSSTEGWQLCLLINQLSYFLKTCPLKLHFGHHGRCIFLQFGLLPFGQKNPFSLSALYSCSFSPKSITITRASITLVTICLTLLFTFICKFLIFNVYKCYLKTSSEVVLL